jgi:hypothetical protein
VSRKTWKKKSPTRVAITNLRTALVGLLVDAALPVSVI